MLQPDPTLWPHCKYLVCQWEECPTTKRMHLQGYAEFDTTMSLSTLNQLEGIEGSNWGSCDGTAEQNRKYCTKEDSRVCEGVEWGEMQRPGKRSDLTDAAELIRKAPQMKRIAEEFPSTFIRYHKGLQAYAALFTTHRDWRPVVEIRIGPSRSGKSYGSRTDYPDAYWKPSGPWWNGYDGQEVVVLDEFYGHSMPYTDLLRLLDSTPLQVQTKGGFVPMLAKVFIFTSNQHPQQWYDAEKTHKMPWAQSPLCKRIEEFGRIIMYPAKTAVPVSVHADYGVPQNDNPFEIAEIDFGFEPNSLIVDLTGPEGQ